MKKAVVSKEFISKEDAYAYAKEVRGFVEGPFVDDKHKAMYVVFFKDLGGE